MLTGKAVVYSEFKNATKLFLHLYNFNIFPVDLYTRYLYERETLSATLM